MRVEVLTDRPADRFVVGAQLYREGSPAALTIVEAWPATPGWVLLFGEVASRQAAEAFRDAYLEVRTGPADRLRRGAYYWHELFGVAVRDPDGADLGTVRDVYRAGGADVLEVVGGPRGDFDLPIARPFVRILAPRRGEIIADPEALDLPASGGLRPPAPPRPPRPRRAPRRRPAGPAAAPSAEASPNVAVAGPSGPDATPPAAVVAPRDPGATPPASES